MVRIPSKLRFEEALENVMGCAKGDLQHASSRFANSAVVAYPEALSFKKIGAQNLD